MGQHDGFRSLQVWQRSKDLAVSIYTLSREGTIARDFGLIDQIRRAAVSIPSNIAEGDERQTNKESVQFFYIAKGSLAELRTQLEGVWELKIPHLGYDKCSEMLVSLVKLFSINPNDVSICNIRWAVGRPIPMLDKK